MASFSIYSTYLPGFPCCHWPTHFDVDYMAIHEHVNFLPTSEASSSPKHQKTQVDVDTHCTECLKDPPFF